MNSVVGNLDLTHSWAGIAALVVFGAAYALVITEEFTRMRKSKPVVLAAGVIWAIIGIRYILSGQSAELELAVREYLAEFAELFLFLLVAMTYVNSMSERGVFEVLRSRLIRLNLGARTFFWVSGFISFFLSAVIDNLTTALVMGGVVLAVGKGYPRFIAISCVNIVVAANAGGAFSPFGDITTLMVWQDGQVRFEQFFALLLPSLVNYLVPAVFMSMTVGKGALDGEVRAVYMRPGAVPIMALFGLTIVLAVTFHNFLHLPPFMGMMTGLACLQIFGYFLRRWEKGNLFNHHIHMAGDIAPYDDFRMIARAEWDTLLFFFGVIMSVGGLAFVGYLDHVSAWLYHELGHTTANVLVGVASAVIDNIPVMVAVLNMEPQMDLQQWLLVTLTAGTGGSLLSVGSAAGVALMGQARGNYSFFMHLKWTPLIALGYAAGIWVHLLIN
jgi:Na+/H+ antiporter NhaD/arsenite permease-like protein